MKMLHSSPVMDEHGCDGCWSHSSEYYVIMVVVFVIVMLVFIVVFY